MACRSSLSGSQQSSASLPPNRVTTLIGTPLVGPCCLRSSNEDEAATAGRAGNIGEAVGLRFKQVDDRVRHGRALVLEIDERNGSPMNRFRTRRCLQR